jgi:hypothetical protein
MSNISEIPTSSPENKEKEPRSIYSGNLDNFYRKIISLCYKGNMRLNSEEEESQKEIIKQCLLDIDSLIKDNFVFDKKIEWKAKPEFFVTTALEESEENNEKKTIPLNLKTVGLDIGSLRRMIPNLGPNNRKFKGSEVKNVKRMQYYLNSIFEQISFTYNNKTDEFISDRYEEEKTELEPFQEEKTESKFKKVEPKASEREKENAEDFINDFILKNDDLTATAKEFIVNVVRAKRGPWSLKKGYVESIIQEDDKITIKARFIDTFLYIK